MVANRYDHTEFQQIGEMTLIGRSYLVPFRIDSKGLLKQLDSIESSLTRVHTFFLAMQQNLDYQKGRKSLQPDHHITSLIPDSLNQHLNFLIEDVHKHKSNIINFLKTNPISLLHVDQKLK